MQAANEIDEQTSEATEEVTTPTPAAAAAPDPFAMLADLLALVTDAKGCGVRLRDLQAKTAALTKAAAEAAVARAALAEREAELTARAAEIGQRAAERESRILVMLRDVEHSRSAFRDHADKIRQLDEQMRRRVAHYGGLLEQFNDKLQDLPSWDQIDAAYGIRDDGNAFDEGADEFLPPEPVEGVPAGVTLTRSRPRRGSQAVM